MHGLKSVALGKKNVYWQTLKKDKYISVIACLRGLCSDDLTRIQIYVK